VNLEFEDAGTSQRLNQLAQRAETEAGPPEEWAGPALPPLPDVTSDAVHAALLQLQQMLHVEAGEASPEGLQRAHAMLESCVLPALAELAKQQQRQQQGQPQEPQQQQTAMSAAAGGTIGAEGGSSSTAQQAAAAAMLAQYPLGFSTGDGAADLAATILRMLYIKDLRALQVNQYCCRCPLLAECSVAAGAVHSFMPCGPPPALHCSPLH
jgi:RLL motif-containing protein 1